MGNAKAQALAALRVLASGAAVTRYSARLGFWWAPWLSSPARARHRGPGGARGVRGRGPEDGGNMCGDGCNAWGASPRALLTGIGKLSPVWSESVRVGLLTDEALGMARAGRWLPMALPAGKDPWK